MEPSQELRDVVTGWFKAVAAGDASWADRHVSRRGDVLLVGTDPNGKKASPRWGDVFHREDGQGKLVQLHASIGVGNEELLR